MQIVRVAEGEKTRRCNRYRGQGANLIENGASVSGCGQVLHEGAHIIGFRVTGDAGHQKKNQIFASLDRATRMEDVVGDGGAVVGPQQNPLALDGRVISTQQCEYDGLQVTAVAPEYGRLVGLRQYGCFAFDTLVELLVAAVDARCDLFLLVEQTQALGAEVNGNRQQDDGRAEIEQRAEPIDGHQ